MAYFYCSKDSLVCGDVFFAEDGSIIDAANIALNGTFAGTWYVLLGSSVAFLVSAITNNVLNFGIGKMFKKKS